MSEKPARPRKPRRPEHRAWHPATYTSAVAYAVQALAKGRANDFQQKLALDWIINNACGTYQQSFAPEASDETVFACGRRAVGLELVKLVNLPSEMIAAIKAKEKAT